MKVATKNIRERVWEYAERYFQTRSRTEFPTVRQVARALGVRQSEVEQATEDHDLLMLTSYNTSPPMPLGDHFVETFEKKEVCYG